MEQASEQPVDLTQPTPMTAATTEPKLAVANEVVVADVVATGAATATPPPIPATRQPRGRRVKLPAILLVATCLSTFWVGASNWDFLATISEPVRMLREHWWQGTVYM